MSASPFFPRKFDFVKKAARQLQSGFPGLPLHLAQEGVASALGFASWFDCSSRLASHLEPSAPDEQVSPEERLLRRYQQIIGIVDATGLAISEVEDFVRRWNLTADAPATRLAGWLTTYEAAREELDEIEAGTREREELWKWGGDLPERIADDMIIADIGAKYAYVCVSTACLLKIPYYLRGNMAAFHSEDQAYWLSLAFPDLRLPQRLGDGALEELKGRSPWTYEWHTGTPAKESRMPTLASMAAAADADPSGWFALSTRHYLDPNSRGFGEEAFAALRGDRFAAFLRDRGRLRLSDVSWFRPRASEGVLPGDSFRDSVISLDDATFARLNMADVVPCLPMYASPFVHGPMFNYEYMNTEGGALPLDLEYDYSEEDVEESAPAESESLDQESLLLAMSAMTANAAEEAKNRPPPPQPKPPVWR